MRIRICGAQYPSDDRGIASLPLLTALIVALVVPWFLMPGPLSLSTDIGIRAAKTALISYASSYQDHYGPLGAGPGHLPCPDTDFVRGSNSQSAKFPGPNPPCGTTEIVMGFLPQRIQLANERYVFNKTTHSTIWYAVSTRYVNNPVNRVINNRSLQSDGDAAPMVAWVLRVSDVGDAASTHQRLSSVLSKKPIDTESLRALGVAVF